MVVGRLLWTPSVPLTQLGELGERPCQRGTRSMALLEGACKPVVLG